MLTRLTATHWVVVGAGVLLLVRDKREQNKARMPIVNL